MFNIWLGLGSESARPWRQQKPDVKYVQDIKEITASCLETVMIKKYLTHKIREKKHKRRNSSQKHVLTIFPKQKIKRRIQLKQISYNPKRDISPTSPAERESSRSLKRKPKPGRQVFGRRSPDEEPEVPPKYYRGGVFSALK